MKPLAPVRRQMIVPVDAALAFAVFTDEIALWWPSGQGHSVFGAHARPVFRGGKVIEVDADGATAEWGTLLEWSPPRRFRMTWHPGSGPEVSTELSVSFEQVAGGQTLVTLEHWEWERLASPAEIRDGYAKGWRFVLGKFIEKVAGAERETGGAPDASKEAEQVWLALTHSPGPAIEPGGSVFAHPGMRAHFGFIGQLAERGALHAAGPLGDDGDGMTIVKLADAGEAAEIVRMAQDEDPSVVEGVLQVRVRPWHVRMTGGE